MGAKSQDSKDSKTSSKSSPPSPLSQANMSRDEPAPAYESHGKAESNPAPAHIPTVSSPFDFPTSETAPPNYFKPATTLTDEAGGSSSKSSSPKLIAIPQVKPGAKSSFLSAYAPILLTYGITETTWKSFLDTLSAFLTASVSDRAISHATDMAQHVGRETTQLGKNIVSHAKAVGSEISTYAKRGNVLGAVVSTVVGSVSLPVFAALGVINTALSLPTSAIGAVARKPRTPLERATTYTIVANNRWFHERGLHAQILNTDQVAQTIGISVLDMLEMVKKSKEDDPSRQLDILLPYIERLDFQEVAVPLHLEKESLWVVIIPWRK